MTSSFVAELARRLQGQSAALALALTWIATSGDPYLPKLYLDRSQAAVDLRYIGALLLLMNALALLLLWLRRRSVLGLWLIVVLCGSIGNALVGWILNPGRFSLAVLRGPFFPCHDSDGVAYCLTHGDNDPLGALGSFYFR